jgi:hypothetical protein
MSKLKFQSTIRGNGKVVKLYEAATFADAHHFKGLLFARGVTNTAVYLFRGTVRLRVIKTATTVQCVGSGYGWPEVWTVTRGWTVLATVKSEEEARTFAAKL